MTNIREIYKNINPNFMTPTIIKYDFTIDNRVVELSKGETFEGGECFAVSELKQEGDTLETTKRGELFFTRSEAVKYYKNLLIK